MLFHDKLEIATIAIDLFKIKCITKTLIVTKKTNNWK